MIQNDQISNAIKLCDNVNQKRISDIKFHQISWKLSFLMIYNDFYITFDPNWSKNGLKWSEIV